MLQCLTLRYILCQKKLIKLLFFSFKSLSNADHLRYVTLKLGKFLDIGNIDLIDMHQITARYIIDLNLPRKSCLVFYCIKNYSKFNFFKMK